MVYYNTVTKISSEWIIDVKDQTIKLPEENRRKS